VANNEYYVESRSNLDPVFKIDDFGGLYIKGNGEFTGKITAKEGEFNGKIVAKTGLLENL